MEEKILKNNSEIKLLDMPLVQDKDAFSYTAPVKKRNGIGLYLLLTVSVALFTICFSAIDFSLFFIKNGGSDLFAEYALGSILGADVDRESEENGNGTDKDVLNAYETVDKNDEIIFQYDSDEQTSAPVDEEPDDGTKEDAESEEETEKEGTKYSILSMDLCAGTPENTYISNETGYKPDIDSLLKKENVLPSDDGAIKKELPLVLIIHTHGTEAYFDKETSSYFDDGSDISRTTDKTKNVVAIGGIISEELENAGIKTIHCETMHDEKSYQESYSRAASTIQQYLLKYPSIKYVFDVHRDAILRSDGTLIKAVTKIDGEETAQVMAVVGSNYKGANFSDWENHLAFAVQLRKNLNSEYKNFCRPAYLRGAAYNEQYTPGSLLLEIGSSGNTLDEAKRAAKLVGKELADMILSAAEQ